jgi:Spy/CpxP family protein refolding chaperone
MTRLSSRISLAVAGVAIAFLMAEVAAAQRGGGRGFGGRGGMISAVALASNETVESELKLTEEQKQQIEEIRDSMREEMQGLRDQDGGSRREAMEKINQDTAAKLAEVLDDEQEKRLAGIMIQVDLATALNQPYVLAQLNLTDEQQTKLEDAADANRRAMRDAFQEIGDLSREERRAKMEEVRTTAEKNLTDALTTEQQAKLEELKGEPVDIDRRDLFRGRGGDRGRRGGQDN